MGDIYFSYILFSFVECSLTIEEKCLYISNSKDDLDSWKSAGEECEDRGGQLLSLENAQEFIDSISQTYYAG